jgi:hypothetical protein
MEQPDDVYWVLLLSFLGVLLVVAFGVFVTSL